MMNLILVSAALGLQQPQQPPTVDDVTAMQARIPNECSLYGAGACPKSWGPPHYERLNDAREIAEAIAAGVASEANPWLRAAQGAIYAAFEGGNKRSAVGDGGASHGAWQQKGLSVIVANTPMTAFPMWLAKVERSERACAALPPDEQLAAVASGNCEHGREKVRYRARLVPKVLGFLEPAD